MEELIRMQKWLNKKYEVTNKQKSVAKEIGELARQTTIGMLNDGSSSTSSKFNTKEGMVELSIKISR